MHSGLSSHHAMPLPAISDLAVTGDIVGQSYPDAARVDPMGEQDEVYRGILPIPEQVYVGLMTYDAKDPDTKFPPIEPLRPPKGAPNVLIVLLDDVGFAASSAFGGVISTPTAERLAKDGLKFNRFHTTALRSPTRQALLTGRNHHSVNMGAICELATSALEPAAPNRSAPSSDGIQI
jgi:arylsulfatase